jgi:hypothetical protein
MRTMIDLPDELLLRAKSRAALVGISLREFFVQAIQQSSRQRRKRAGVRLPQSVAQTPRALESSPPSRLMKQCLVDGNVWLARGLDVDLLIQP